MSSTNAQCLLLVNSFQDSIEKNLKTAHADEIFKLQKYISTLQDRLTELEPTPDPLLTIERVRTILREESIELISLKSGWHRFEYEGKIISINAHGGRFRDAIYPMYPSVSSLLNDKIWIGVHKKNMKILTNINIPIGEFENDGRIEKITDGSAGKIYTTKPVHESTLRNIIAELKK